MMKHTESGQGIGVPVGGAQPGTPMPEDQICFMLYAASREVIKRYRPFLERLGLTYTQYVTMTVFWHEKRLTVKQLGKRLYLDSGTLTPVLKSLEAKGLVCRSRSKEDERVLDVEITEKGERTELDARSAMSSLPDCVKLDPGEIKLLRSLLYKLL